MNNIQLFQYNNTSIEFEVIEGQVYANATAMCQAFGKRPNEWLRLPSTQRYIEALKAVRENPALVEFAGRSKSSDGITVTDRN